MGRDFSYCFNDKTPDDSNESYEDSYEDITVSRHNDQIGLLDRLCIRYDTLTEMITELGNEIDILHNTFGEDEDEDEDEDVVRKNDQLKNMREAHRCGMK
jgi:hypothetical protein